MNVSPATNSTGRSRATHRGDHPSDTGDRAGGEIENELPRSTPESVGVSSSRLQRIGEAIQRHIDEKHISGAVSLVAPRDLSSTTRRTESRTSSPSSR